MSQYCQYKCTDTCENPNTTLVNRAVQELTASCLMSLYYLVNLGSAGIDKFLFILFNNAISNPYIVGQVCRDKPMNTLECLNRYGDRCRKEIGCSFWADFTARRHFDRLRATLTHF